MRTRFLARSFTRKGGKQLQNRICGYISAEMMGFPVSFCMSISQGEAASIPKPFSKDLRDMFTVTDIRPMASLKTSHWSAAWHTAAGNSLMQFLKGGERN